MAMEEVDNSQDNLAQLFAGRLGGNAAALIAQAAKGVTPGAMGAAPGATPPAMGIPGMPSGAGMPAATTPPVMPSDDPTLQPKLPTVPKFQAPPVDALQDVSKRITQASTPVVRSEHQPHMWERILAPLLAGAVGYGDEAGGIKAGNALLNRRYNLAVENQNKTVTPLEGEFKRLQGIEPFINSANANAQHTFEDEDARYKNWNATNDRQDAIQQRETAARERTEERQDEASNTPAPNARPELRMVDGKPQLQVRTKTGVMIPYVAKSIDEGAMLGDPKATELYKMAHRDKSGETKPATKEQFAAVDSKRAQAYAKAHTQYLKETEDLPLDDPKHEWTPAETAALNRAKANFDESMQAAQDAWENEVGDLGGNAGGHHQVTPSVKAGTPAGTPASAGTAHMMTDEVKHEPARSGKTTTKDVVQKYAKSHNMTYNTALKGFQKNGYKVQ